MKTFLISDTHIQDGSCDDRFLQHYTSFLNFLKMVEFEMGRLIIVGDFLDGWRANLLKIIKEYRELLNKLMEMDVIWVLGNHDIEMMAFAGWFQIHRELYLENFNIFHGDGLDETMDGKQERKLARAVCYLSTKVERYVPQIKTLEHYLLQGHRVNEPYVEKIKATLSPGNYIFGHSHKPEIFEEIGFGTIINTGSGWRDQDRLSYVVLENKRATLKYWGG